MRHVAHLGVARGMVEHAQILGDRRAGQRLMVGGVSASDTCSAPSEEKSSFELRHCSTFTLSKVWFCSALHQFRLERRAAAGGAEGAVARGAPGAAGDLREFGRIQPAELIAVDICGRRRRRRDRRRG